MDSNSSSSSSLMPEKSKNAKDEKKETIMNLFPLTVDKIYCVISKDEKIGQNLERVGGRLFLKSDENLEIEISTKGNLFQLEINPVQEFKDVINMNPKAFQPYKNKCGIFTFENINEFIESLHSIIKGEIIKRNITIIPKKLSF